MSNVASDDGWVAIKGTKPEIFKVRERCLCSDPSPSNHSCAIFYQGEKEIYTRKLNVIRPVTFKIQGVVKTAPVETITAPKATLEGRRQQLGTDP